MKPYSKKLITVFLALFALENLIQAAEPKTVQVPEVTLQYASTYDEVCSNKYSYPIEAKWKQELISRLPRWRELWKNEGTKLLRAAVQITGKSFREKNFKAALSLCSFPSISTPLLINARYTLLSLTESPNSDSVLIGIIEHEILHHYLDSFLPRSTPILTKYKNETKGVLAHLHLLALQKASYLDLHWETKLKQVVARDLNLPNPDYQRAWEIVNEKGNYQSLLGELKYAPDRTLEPDLEI